MSMDEKKSAAAELGGGGGRLPRGEVHRDVWGEGDSPCAMSLQRSCVAAPCIARTMPGSLLIFSGNYDSQPGI